MCDGISRNARGYSLNYLKRLISFQFTYYFELQIFSCFVSIGDSRIMRLLGFIPKVFNIVANIVGAHTTHIVLN